MAPKRKTTAAKEPKAKDLTRLTPREREWEELRPTTPFFPPGETQTGVNKLAAVVASKRNENGGTVLKASNTPPSALQALDVRVFVCFLLAGLEPPMSAFLVAVLAEYGILLAHLPPNAVLTLAIFQHLCECFVGIHPSVALFRHYYYPRVEAGHMSGGVTFRLRDGMMSQYILVDKKKWEEWRHRWCYVHFPEPNESLAEPTMVISTKAPWRTLDAKDALFQPAYDRILMLRNLGLCGRQVVSHFISRCIAPLQSRSHPMWQFSGVNDTTRLFVGPQAAFERQTLDLMVNELTGGSDGYEKLSPGIHALYVNTRVDEILAMMPLCNEFGIVADWVPPSEYARLILPAHDDQSSDDDDDGEGFLLVHREAPATVAPQGSHAPGSSSGGGEASASRAAPATHDAPGSTPASASTEAPGSSSTPATTTVTGNAPAPALHAARGTLFSSRNWDCPLRYAP